MGNNATTGRISRRTILRAGAVAGAGAALAAVAPPALAGERQAKHSTGGALQVEPNAGSWKTWLLSSGSELRLPPPPGKFDTRDELDELRALAGQRDAAALDQ